jgi:hypothetical protein
VDDENALAFWTDAGVLAGQGACFGGDQSADRIAELLGVCG